MGHAPVEYVELDLERRWAYLRRYYETASAFYGMCDRVVNDAEVAAAIRAFRRKPLPRIREGRDLRAWRFSLDDDDCGVRDGWFSGMHDEGEWERVELPHSVNHVPEHPVRYGRSRYRVLAPEPGSTWGIWKGEYTTWYKTRVDVPDAGPERVAYLGFDSVNLLADVWVNEAPVMIGHLGLFPFRMEVTEELAARDGGDVVIALRVSNRATNTPYLFANGAQLAYAHPPYTRHPYPVDTQDEAWSGIAGDAMLEIMDRRHLEDAFFSTEQLVEGEAVVDCRLEVRNETWRPFAGSVRIEVARWLPEEEKPCVVVRSPVAALPMNDAAFDVKIHVEDARPWSPESPQLYLAHVALVDGEGRDIDDLFETFGVRTFRMEGAHFLLNGRRVVPRGTHDLSNYFGESLICPSDRAIVLDILLHRHMNAICSRWPSDMRMHYGRIAEYADQLGYLISWSGYFEMWTVHPEMELYARRDVRAMVRSLRNHPSIVVWEMGDEPLMELHHYRRFRWYEEVYDLVAAEDRSRPIIPAGFWGNELVDLIERYPAPELSVEERRRRVLEQYPLFTRELAPWDYHYCPYLATNEMAPTHRYVELVRESLGGERATVFTEFGIDGMPRFENVQGVYGTFRWSGWGLMPVNRARSDANYYGRPVGQQDWRETQAAQALVLSGIIGRLRSHPDDFAAFYLVTLVDPWTFHWGVVDAAYNAKLAYFVVRSCYATVLLSALHGTTVVRAEDGPLDVTVSNLGHPLSRASLEVRFRDRRDRTAREQTVAELDLAGNVAVSRIAELDPAGLPPDLYALELRLADAEGSEVARSLELFYLDT